MHVCPQPAIAQQLLARQEFGTPHLLQQGGGAVGIRLPKGIGAAQQGEVVRRAVTGGKRQQAQKQERQQTSHIGNQMNTATSHSA